MASNSGEDDIVGKLRRKLQTLEPSIREMLSLRRPTSILKEKLLQVEEIVMDIPEEYPYLATEWRGKLAQWYRRFSSTLPEIETEPDMIESDDSPAPSPRSPLKPHLAFSIAAGTPPPASEYVSASMLAAAVASVAPIAVEVTSGDEWTGPPPSVVSTNVPKLPNDDHYRPVDPNQPMTSTPANSTFNDNSNSYSNGNISSHYDDQYLGKFMDDKQTVRSQLEDAFNKLQPLENFAIVEEVKRLTKLVAKADELLDPYWRDRHLMAAIMERISEKMPRAKWDQFGAYIGETGMRTVRNLKRFLVRQLKIAYEELKAIAEQEAKVAAAAALLNGGEESGEGTKFCVYCRKTGHIVDDCIDIKYTLCTICFEDGHTQRRCPVLEAQQNWGY